MVRDTLTHTRTAVNTRTHTRTQNVKVTKPSLQRRCTCTLMHTRQLFCTPQVAATPAAPT